MELSDLKNGDQDYRWFYKYPEMVLSGEIIACKKVKWMCMRHMRDLERNDIYFDVDEANSIVNFFSKHVPMPDGDHAGEKIKLDPVQIFLSCSLVGWKWSETVHDEDGEIKHYKGRRRFNHLFMLVARKFGKTSWIAGVKLYLMYKAGHNPRVYSLATKLDQARIAWNTAKNMIELSPTLRKIFKPRAHDILMPKKNGEFRALASDSKSLDGLNPIAAILDECHAVRDRNLYGVIGSAFGAQPEYLFSVITTAGFILDGLCTDLYKNGTRVLDPDDIVDQDSYFYAIYETDDGDDWSDSQSWYKSNPALHFGRPSMSYLKGQYQEATLSLEEKANFLTKHCNRFVNGTDKWLNIEDVKKGLTTINLDDFKHRECSIGLDRGMTNDITSASVVFSDDDGGATRIGFNLQCQGAINNAGDLLAGIYRKAIDLGELKVVPGESVRNHDVVRFVSEICELFPNNSGVYYDPYHMKDVALDLEDAGYVCVAVSQGMGNMSEPSKTVEGIIKDGLFRYSPSVLFEYACSCALIKVSTFSNQMVYRDPSQWKVDKIDPIISTIIGFSGLTLIKVGGSSIYEQRGLLNIWDD